MNQKLKIIGRYSDYRIGEIISPPGSLQKYLLDLKVAELVKEIPTTTATPDIVIPAKRGRGRPRKYPQ